MNIINIISFLPWYLFAILYGVIVSLIPGPVIILSLKYALSKDLKQIVSCMSGLFLAEIIYVVLILVGYHVYLVEQKTLLNFITIIGGICVILVGIHTLFLREGKSIIKMPSFKRPHHTFIKCFLIAIFNPAILLILLAALKPYNDYYSKNIVSPVYFLLIELSSLFYYLILIFIFYNARILQTEKMMQVINKCAGILLIAIGILVII